MRREGDSNPRYACDAHTLSRRAPSATRSSLLYGHNVLLFNLYLERILIIVRQITKKIIMRKKKCIISIFQALYFYSTLNS